MQSAGLTRRGRTSVPENPGKTGPLKISGGKIDLSE
jgi:hypothetical protein